MFLDAHIHLQDIQDKAVSETILREAPLASVGRFFCNAVKAEDWPAIDRIAKQYRTVVPFLGIHPWAASATSEPGWKTGLDQYMRCSGAGLGEIGLDRAKKEIAFAKQTELFTRQVDLACRLGKPFVVHCVKAWSELLEILKPRINSGGRWMIHSFSGSQEILSEVIAMGAYVSFSWKQFGRQTDPLKEILNCVPENRLLLETDFPYLGLGATTPLTAQNYFDCLKETYQKAAELKALRVEQLAETVWDNGKAFLS